MNGSSGTLDRSTRSRSASFACPIRTHSSGRVSPRPARARSATASARGQELERAVEQAIALERLHQRLVRLEALARDGLLLAQDLHLQVVVVEHLRAHVVRELGEQRVPRLRRDPSALDGQVDQDLEVDLVVRAVDPGGVVDRVRVDAPARERVLDAPGLRGAEVAALGDDAHAQLAAVDADRVVRAIADRVVRLVARLHEGADAAVPEQVDGCAQDRLAQLGRRQRLRGDRRARHAPRASASTDFALRGKTPPPAEITLGS